MCKCDSPTVTSKSQMRTVRRGAAFARLYNNDNDKNIKFKKMKALFMAFLYGTTVLYINPKP